MCYRQWFGLARVQSVADERPQLRWHRGLHVLMEHVLAARNSSWRGVHGFCWIRVFGHCNQGYLRRARVCRDIGGRAVVYGGQIERGVRLRRHVGLFVGRLCRHK